jgi:hypothetical protein
MSNKKQQPEKPVLVRTPHGMFNARLAGSVNLTPKGVAIMNDDNTMLHWLPEEDPEKAKKLNEALLDLIIDKKPINWKSLGY